MRLSRITIKSSIVLSITVGLLLCFSLFQDSKAAQIDHANDIVSSDQNLETGVEHYLSFMIPPTGHTIIPSDYIRVVFNNFSGVTSPSGGTGWSGSPVFGSSGNVVTITNITAGPNDFLRINGITATNPTNFSTGSLTIQIANNSVGSIVYDSTTINPQIVNGSVSTSVTIIPNVVSTSLRVRGYTTPNSFIQLHIDGVVVATGSSDSNGKFSFLITGLSSNRNINLSLSSEDGKFLTSRSSNYSLFTVPSAMITLSNVILPSTIDITNNDIILGENSLIFGTASANANVTIFFDNPPIFSKTVNSDENGNWSWLYNSIDYPSVLGIHDIYTVQIVQGGFISPTSEYKQINISECLNTDPNCPNYRVPDATDVPKRVNPTITLEPTVTPTVEFIVTTPTPVNPSIEQSIETGVPPENGGDDEANESFIQRLRNSVSDGASEMMESVTIARQNLQEITPNVVKLLPAIPIVSIVAGSLYTYPRFLIFILAWIKDRRKYNPWGFIYNQDTYKPVAFATVRLFRGDEFIKETITNLEGKYGIPFDNGSYRLKIIHPDYHQSEFEVLLDRDEGMIKTNIALEPKIKVRKEGEELQKALLKSQMKDNLKTINEYLFKIGFVVALIVAFIFANFANLLILGIYLLQIGVSLIQKFYYKKSWGTVASSETGKKVKSAFVHVFDLHNKAQLDVQMTDDKGRFFLPVKRGQYYISVDSVGFKFPSKLADKNQLVSTDHGIKFMKVRMLSNRGVVENIQLDPDSTQNLEISKASPFKGNY